MSRSENRAMFGRELQRREEHGELDALCLSLREQLGPFGYQWLCACSVFPVLRLGLTANLGNELAGLAGRESPKEAELLAICRLPWFRKGWMPDEFRARLIDDIVEPFRDPIRQTIERFLFLGLNQPQKTNANAPTFELGFPPANWRLVLRSWRSLSTNGIDPDACFDSFMERQGHAQYRFDVAIRRSFGLHFHSIVDLRAILFFLLAAMSSIALWFVPSLF